MTNTSRSDSEYWKTEIVLKYALRNIEFSLGDRGRGGCRRETGMTDRGPAKGFDEGRIFINSTNEAEDTIIGASR